MLPFGQHFKNLIKAATHPVTGPAEISDQYDKIGNALFIAGIVVCLANFGVSAKAISLTGGALGVVFGIACKNVFDDIFSGIIIIAAVTIDCFKHKLR